MADIEVLKFELRYKLYKYELCFCINIITGVICIRNYSQNYVTFNNVVDGGDCAYKIMNIVKAKEYKETYSNGITKTFYPIELELQSDTKRTNLTLEYCVDEDIRNMLIEKFIEFIGHLRDNDYFQIINKGININKEDIQKIKSITYVIDC